MKNFHLLGKLTNLNLIQIFKTFSLAFFLVLTNSLLSSCEESKDTDILDLKFQKEVSDLQEVFLDNGNVSENLKIALAKEALEISDFDFKSFKKQTLDDVDGNTILVTNKVNDKVVLASLQIDNVIKNPFLIIIKEYRVEYYDLYNNQNINVAYNQSREIVLFESHAINSSLTVLENAKVGAVAGCGYAVNECIKDVYNNHGWLSTWAYVQSAFIPPTAAAFAVACAAKNCGGCSCGGASGSY